MRNNKRAEVITKKCRYCTHLRAFEDQDGEICERCLYPGALDERAIDAGYCPHFVPWDE